jgi:hypothetical protein
VASGGSSIYHSFVKDRLAEQDARKNSFEQRALAVITTSGALATLLLAFAALVTKSNEFELTSSARCLVVAATVAFATAALAAVATNLPLNYASVRAEQMGALVKERWGDEEAIAEQRITATLVNLIANAKKLNRIKGWLLFSAVTIEGLAVILLAIAVGVILA